MKPMPRLQSSTKSDRDSYPVRTAAPILILLWSRSAGWVGRRHPLGDESFVIGRRVGAVVRIEMPEDDRMSRRHAAVSCVGEPDAANGQLTVWVTDQGSKNGTFVNGRRLTQMCRLFDGDILRVGSTLFMIRYEQAAQLDAVAPGLDGQAPVIRSVRHELRRIAQQLEPVLILGESGTGKERAARAVHELSGRRGEFVAVNCAGITESLAEGLLFGTERGAFTGAAATKGLFLAADGGTLLLDEIGELPLSIQPKLLRAIQEREVLPVGRTRPVSFDARLITATHRNLKAAVGKELFRLDLLSRLEFHVLKLPPLRQRREDVLPLLLTRLSRNGKPAELTVRLAEALLLHEWPMNIREVDQLASLLRSHVENETPLDLPLLEDKLRVTLPPDKSAGQGPIRKDDKPKRERSSSDLLRTLFADCAGNISEISRRLNLSRRQTSRRLTNHGLLRTAFDENGDDAPILSD